MCGCNNKNNVDLQSKKIRLETKIYLSMAKYEVKSEWLGKGLSTRFHDSGKRPSFEEPFLDIDWDNASQEDLARAYEELNGGDSFINKIENSSEKKSSKAKKPNKDEGKNEGND